MVKAFHLLMTLCFISLPSHAQSSKKIVVEAGNRISDVISFKELYSHPEFTEGTISFKDGTVYKPKLNYNLLTAQVQFISAKGDTLSIANEVNLQSIVIGSNVFFFDKTYVQLVKEANNIKLAVQRKIEMDDSQKIGAFGQPTSGAGVLAINNVVAGGQLYNLPLNQRITLSRKETFYIGDSTNHFEVLNKKSLLKMFPNHKTEIEGYLKDNKVNFSDQDAVTRLTGYLANI